ncbi:putative recombination protein/DNA repair protein [uncultured phage cr50_1]|uniref:Putative recombination protein/DNA repair protein n=1 Tax=uncultured phage cr50_1 TaxID=2772059 RepID=A0A7M1RUB2_9CAUD|nr:putative recombination protein/DNA repair protein [uncultured phage cr50_1]QOR58015.1 putative recombination protein/DNA repair protein [uncultured phage cr50_1]
MLKELTVKEVEAILSKENNVYGIDSIGDHIYRIPDLGYTGPKGATKFVNELRQQINELSTKLS